MRKVLWMCGLVGVLAFSFCSNKKNETEEHRLEQNQESLDDNGATDTTSNSIDNASSSDTNSHSEL